jgi:hypothetical protein
MMPRIQAAAQSAGIGFDIPVIVQSVQKHEKEQVTLVA